ncbi:hypothetical protein BaRGS_00020556 [Batillaria attramentaria]|uniref:INO80 complex subunit E N-terminal domain-containing protein n=1 Tax=Batillaria attramentaria TaxID=370345 RepID=A0ABD0KM27_9CAEN
MPVPEPYAEPQIDYKQKYKALKKRLKLLVYEQECFLEELRKAQRKLLKVARDRSFLLDRLVQYEKVDDSSGDSDATASSDSDGEGHHREGTPAKRKRVSGHGSGSVHHQASGSGESSQAATPASIASIILAQVEEASGGKAAGESSQASHVPASMMPGQMTREELERHLDAKQNAFGIEKASASLPMEIFSNDNSNNANDQPGNGVLLAGDDDEEDLVIDVPH